MHQDPTINPPIILGEGAESIEEMNDWEFYPDSGV